MVHRKDGAVAAAKATQIPSNHGHVAGPSLELSSIEDLQLSSITKVLLLRETVQADSKFHSLPRFSLLGLLWAAIELGVFCLTFATMDFSLESIDMARMMVQASESAGSNLTAGLTASTEEFGTLKMNLVDTSMITVLGGSIESPSDYCGFKPHSTYFRYLTAQALIAISQTTVSEFLHPSSQERATDKTEEIGVTPSTTSEKSRNGLQRHNELLKLLVCNRSIPLLDERHIVRNATQPCNKPQLHPNSSGLLHFCPDLDFAYHSKMMVLGVRSLCFYVHPRHEPQSNHCMLCVGFGEQDLKRDDLQWIIERLLPAWQRIKVSAAAWIILSIAMRIAYWWTVVQVTRMSLSHLRRDCRATLENSKRALQEHQQLHDTTKNRKLTTSSTIRSWSKQKDLLTATSIGIAAANNDIWYLGLAVIRQMLGGTYAEILLSVVSTPRAAWQAMSIVAYHEAVILTVFHLTKRIGPSRWRKAVPSIADVGLLGYISFFFVAVVVQGNQLFDFDLFYILKVINWVKWTLWWLVLPDCGPDEPCIVCRADIVGHTLAALYACIFALVIQNAVTYIQKRKRRPTEFSNSSGGTEEKSSTSTNVSVSRAMLRSTATWLLATRTTSASSSRGSAATETTTTLHSFKGGQQQRNTVPIGFGQSDPLAFLGTVGCPRCYSSLALQPCLIEPEQSCRSNPSGPRSTEGGNSVDANERVVLHSSFSTTPLQQNVRRRSITKDENTGSTTASAPSERCCLWSECRHLDDQPKTTPTDITRPKCALDRVVDGGCNRQTSERLGVTPYRFLQQYRYQTDLHESGESSQHDAR